MDLVELFEISRVPTLVLRQIICSVVNRFTYCKYNGLWLRPRKVSASKLLEEINEDFQANFS